MIKEFVARFDANRAELREALGSYYNREGTYQSWEIEYKDIVREVIRFVRGDEYPKPDPNNIHEINDGEYQGTLIFVIAESGYQPDKYWYVKVSYGSCSGCDTLHRITEFDDCSEQALDDLMTLALHIVQGLKAMDDDPV